MAAIVIIILLAIAYFAFYKTLTQNNSQTPADGASQGKLNINVVCDNALTSAHDPPSPGGFDFF
jgi:hypothetical protein